MSPPKADKSELPLVAHLVELRDRLLRVIAVIVALFLSMIYFANDLYATLAAPLMAHLPVDGTMIATDVASPFFTPFKLTLVLSIFLAMPMLLYQFWGFVAPGLYRHEKKLVLPLLVSSTGLFYLGGVFAYFVVFPLVFGFFSSVAPDGVAIMTDISKYLDFVLKMFFAFGLAFEVPIVVVVLVWAGITTADSLAEKRPYIIVSVFVLAMLLTPPDAISQTLLAIPMLILFEMGLFFAKKLDVSRGEICEQEGSQADASAQAQDDDVLTQALDKAEAEENKLNR
ncbi:MAG TPA: twin-arginine translocase subunit TatC [Gammaproteobacteria bacterium]|nr:twin-arginine translocase subunit TatC [Gammaproteobacteria bacterium]